MHTITFMAEGIMGKKYLVIEVEEQSYSGGKESHPLLRFLLWIACMIFPPLVFIFNIKREKSSFDEPDGSENGYFCGPCIGTMIVGLLWSIILIGLSAADVSGASRELFDGEAGIAVLAISMTYFAVYLTDLITAIAVQKDGFFISQKTGNALIVILCILFAGGFLTGILLGVL